MDIRICKQHIKSESIKGVENCEKVPIKLCSLWYPSQKAVIKAFVLPYNSYFLAYPASSNKERKKGSDTTNTRISDRGITTDTTNTRISDRGITDKAFHQTEVLRNEIVPNDRHDQIEAIGCEMIPNIPSAYEHLSIEMPKSNKIAVDHLNIGSQSIEKEAIGREMISNIPSAYEHLSTEMPKSNNIAADHLNIGSYVGNQ
ncbi:hypothetical protein LIER_30243 [Lithospermum erythrorhizon]|uniref:Uncharacterized protein n=1 Tax=Lithospermum erythrorhizon TaxID=34254 RepID=A0AAV3RM11_LITER